jgi:hypothetical protein
MSKFIYMVLEWIITVIILMLAEKLVKNAWRLLKNLKNIRTVEITAK